MSNDNYWVLGVGIRDIDFLTFDIANVEHSCKFKNFRLSIGTNIQDNLINTGQLTQLMKVCNNNIKVGSNKWIEGIDCELLQDGLEKKGKIRLKVIIEFIPDEVEVSEDIVDSNCERLPLDDIRQINL